MRPAEHRVLFNDETVRSVSVATAILWTPANDFPTKTTRNVVKRWWGW